MSETNLIPPYPNPSKRGQGTELFCSIGILPPRAYSIKELGTAQSTYFLPFPKELNDIMGQDWQQKELGADMLSRLLTGSEVTGAGAGSDGNTGNAIVNAFFTVGQSLEIGSGAIENVRRKSGLATNNVNTLLFQNPTLRTFQFSWDLIPTNQQLANAQRNMIKEFRIKMHPRLDSSATFATPHLFSFKAVAKGKTLVQTTACAMTNLTWNIFGSNVPAFHSDGIPVHSVLTIELQELVPNTEQSITALYEKS